MILDERITNKLMICDCFETIEAKQYVGKNGYFTNNFTDFAVLSKTAYGTLREIATNKYSEKPYYNDKDNIQYAYFLPEQYVNQEKTLRAFTLEEFIHTVGDVGNCVRYKHKDDPQIIRTVITEIRENTRYVMLGNVLVSTERLFKEFEYYNGKYWVPFGVKE